MENSPSSRRRRVAIVLANAMAVRNTLETPVLSELAQQTDLELCFVTPYGENQTQIASTTVSRFYWADMGAPAGRPLSLAHGPISIVLRRLAERALMKLLRPWADHGNLAYRFNESQGFSGHQFKKKMPPLRRQREAVAGNYVDPSLGKPFPESRTVYNLLRRIYFNTWYSEPSVELFFDEFQPDLIVIHHLQNPSIRPWIAGARRRSLPILGIVGSWDQPTTKGPLPPGLVRVLVQSQAMAEQLIKHHGIEPDHIDVTGWPQMDYYKIPGIIRPKEELASELGLEPEKRIILCGANSPRLGPHEPGIMSFLASNITQGHYGTDVSLVIRPHPKDDQWQSRFNHLHKPPHVVVLPAESGRLNSLLNQLAHASIVLGSAGTILLDSIGMDTCAIFIAFDGDLKKNPIESIEHWTQIDHYRPVLDSGSVAVVRSFDELDISIREYLADPAKDAEGRARCRKEQLEPFDGQASHRLARIIMSEAAKHSHA